MVKNRNRYCKSFIMLSADDSDHASGKDAGGYIKIEDNGHTGRLNLFVQNMREIQDFPICKLYILAKSSDEFYSLDMGNIILKNGEGRLEKKINPGNVENSNFSIDKFNIFLIIAEKGNKSAFFCPLSGYRDKKIDWRDSFSKSFYTNRDKEKEDEIPIENNMEEVDMIKESVSKINTEKENIIDESANLFFETPREDSGVSDERVSGKKEKFPENNCNFCSYATNNFYQQLNINHKFSKNYRKSFCAETFRATLDEYFRKCNPFIIKRSDYVWWRVVCPACLYDVFYSFNIRVPFLLSPGIIDTHFKYQHILAGVFSDRIHNKSFISIGIPGICGIDMNLFENMFTWVQTNGRATTQGEFGYWIAYIEPETGKILKSREGKRFSN